MEVLVNNTWGILSGGLTDTGATILCTQLGGGKGIVALKGTFPEAGTGYLYYIAWFNCTNSHKDLLSCTNVASMTTSAQQVGVVCDVPQGKYDMPCNAAQRVLRARSLPWAKQLSLCTWLDCMLHFQRLCADMCSCVLSMIWTE